MNATRGCSAAMYVKFCSGPTPTYTPPGGLVTRKRAITCCSPISFDTKFSERK